MSVCDELGAACLRVAVMANGLRRRKAMMTVSSDVLVDGRMADGRMASGRLKIMTFG